ncbi:hypothetical protein PACTADRAFT_52187 [Pachysolen tannophilus NRRL Y-2460]|uniref:Protein MAK16 n=1 Tax=Pachysolen tannophilus NRRL Y-2460 TaxID=669874 RepID=A0A1E4TMT3_PACTA|nr:hypothetical protein PACTADRAFT_52187 [Pachysolen tannophilus NRRL Y-2460]
MSDELVWQVINQQFCAFKIKTTKDQNFCRNEYNVTGLCSRQSCPLANSRYATVKSVDGRLYLYMKTAERAHTPNRLWQRLKLSKNYGKALKQIDDNLLYWNKFLIHKCKQRLTRLVQVAMTERRLALREEERHYVGIKHKVKRREENRERKALVAAKIEKAIEKELLERLKSGAYGDKPLNVDEKIWKKILGTTEEEDENEDELLDQVEDLEDDEIEDEDEDENGEFEYVSGDDEDEEEEEIVDLEDLQKWFSESSDSEDDKTSGEDEEKYNKKRSKRSQSIRKRPRVEVEFEEETISNNGLINNA